MIFFGAYLDRNYFKGLSFRFLYWLRNRKRIQDTQGMNVKALCSVYHWMKYYPRNHLGILATLLCNESLNWIVTRLWIGTWGGFSRVCTQTKKAIQHFCKCFGWVLRKQGEYKRILGYISWSIFCLFCHFNPTKPKKINHTFWKLFTLELFLML